MKYLIAICGKSAAGKDTLARALAQQMVNSHLIVKDTSRPMRKNERNGVDYNFVDENEILYNGDNYICRSVYRHWVYGTKASELCSDINIGIFSPNDLLQLKEYDFQDTIIIPVYLDIDKPERKRRSKERNGGRINFEMIRREFADNRDFRNIDHIIKQFGPFIKYYGNGTILYTESNCPNTKYRYNTSINYIIQDIIKKIEGISA